MRTKNTSRYALCLVFLLRTRTSQSIQSVITGRHCSGFADREATACSPVFCGGEEHIPNVRCSAVVPFGEDQACALGGFIITSTHSLNPGYMGHFFKGPQWVMCGCYIYIFIFTQAICMCYSQIIARSSLISHHGDGANITTSWGKMLMVAWHMEWPTDVRQACLITIMA